MRNYLSGIAISFLAACAQTQSQDPPAAPPNDSSLAVISPQASFIPAPQQPTTLPAMEQSVLMGRSHYYAIGNGKGDADKPWYEPVEAGAFRVTGGQRRFNRPIYHFRNHLVTGDLPIFRLKTFHGMYNIPYWTNSPKEMAGTPEFGTLKLGVLDDRGETIWMESLRDTQTTFWPGYTDYVVNGPAGAWKATVRAAPAMHGCGMVCRVSFEGKAQRLTWSFGGVAFNSRKPQPNHVEIQGREVRITEPKELGSGLSLAGWDGQGKGAVAADKEYGQSALFTADQPQAVYHIAAHWGVTQINPAVEQRFKTNLDRSDAASWWPQAIKLVEIVWRERTVEPVLEPEKAFARTLADPAAALTATVSSWDRRREQFVIRTPDAAFNALINFGRATSDYHRDGPAYILGLGYASYQHISVGWYGKEWGGDHADNALNLRAYAIFQGKDNPGERGRRVLNSALSTSIGGWIGWGAWDMGTHMKENNTPYWVDQLWDNYRWTADKGLLKDMWPHVVRAVAWECKYNDPDGDGLFRSHYDYWNGDSGGKGPKGVAPTATAYAMLDAAANIARELGETESEGTYRALAQKSMDAAQRELWKESAGRMGNIGNDGLWQGHPNHWDQYYAVQFGLMKPQQGRRAMRWIESHYGFPGDRPEVRLLMNSDWWPHRWSNHWVPVGDTLLAAMAGMRCGDADLWWPYVNTVVGSAFRSGFPGISFAISNTGAGGGDWEDVDANDPHMHLAVRGLFGIEPEIHQGKLLIAPAFPADWKEASIKTPDVEYSWKRDGAKSVFHIKTAVPLVKMVRATPGGPEVTTKAETESVVTVQAGPTVTPPAQPSHPPSILVDRQPPTPPTPLTAEQKNRLIQVDLSNAYNMAWEELALTRFIFDFEDEPKPITEWWHTPGLAATAMPTQVQTPDGVTYRLSGRGAGESGKKNLLAVASWQPQPLPGGVSLSIDRPCEKLFLLLQSYVMPSRNYLPNGEVTLVYGDGTRQVVQLIPPFNLDAYYQHFSREGVAVPLGELEWPKGWTPVDKSTSQAHADSLAIACDPGKVLKSVEIRATCSHAVIGVAGMTLLTNQK